QDLAVHVHRLPAAPTHLRKRLPRRPSTPFLQTSFCISLRFFKSRRDTPRPPNTVYAWWRNPIMVAMEETLAILEAAQPDGLGAKRRDFRALKTAGSDSMDQFMNHRAELVIASLLAEASISFRFNTKAGPDLLLGEDGNVFG